MSRTPIETPGQMVAKGKPGRPPVYSEEERARRILQAAEDVFTAMGYGAATMSEIARAAGMSKRTLYEYYNDKQHLLAAVTVAADDFPWADVDRPPLADPIAELRRRLLEAIEFSLSPRQVRMVRLLISEAQHTPELAGNFRTRVMEAFHAYVLAAVQRVMQEGVGPDIRDADLMTFALLGASMSRLHLLALFGEAEGTGRGEIALHVDSALQICGFGGESGAKAQGTDRGASRIR